MIMGEQPDIEPGNPKPKASLPYGRNLPAEESRVSTKRGLCLRRINFTPIFRRLTCKNNASNQFPEKCSLKTFRDFVKQR